MILESARGKRSKRIGRGISAGQGKTAGRGTKGQKARAGYDLPKRYEGGQTPLSMRLPKLPGFKSIHRKAVIVSLDDISKFFKDGEAVSNETLRNKGVLKGGQKAKVLNNGELKVNVTLTDDLAVSAKVRELVSKSDSVLSAEQAPIRDPDIKEVKKKSVVVEKPKKSKTPKK